MEQIVGRSIMMNDLSRPGKAEGILSRKLGGETILYHPGQRSVTVLNAAGALAWSCFDRRHTIREVGRRLTEAYEVPMEADPGGDVSELVERLVVLRLLDIHPPPPAVGCQ